jgi:aromatic ring-opening dioxygenase catalytic subunit (LigB family)
MKDQLGGMYDELERSLQAILGQLPSPPRAILVISGHWEAPQPTVMAAATPPMLYDYYGFPPHTYQIRYPAPGSPELAARTQELLAAAGLQPQLDQQRGYDHGAFVPLAVMYPEAKVPVVQLSILSNYDPATHLAMGRALAPLRKEGVLIVGSGLSYHNLRLMGPQAKAPSLAFDEWLRQAVLDSPPEERSAKLQAWASAPYARVAHPQEDHLVPLMVALGAAESEPASLIYHEAAFFGNVYASSFRFGS